MKNRRFLTSLAIAGALMVTSPLSIFAAGKQDLGTENQSDSTVRIHYIQSTLNNFDIEEILRQIGFIGCQMPTQQQPDQSKPAPAKEQAQQSQSKKEQAPNQTAKPAPSQSDASEQQQTSYTLSEFEKQVVDLTNQERAKYGLPALKVDPKLSQMARDKAKDMHDNNYFDHISPTYGSPFDMMKQYGIQFNAAGENIAMGQLTPQEVVNGWMNSEGHRKNILNKDFNYIGVGYVKDGNYWVQEFIGK
ncbi:CAP domain-containing protein [Thermoflavimicrobium dichotomicum]|uniref:Uncharacterized protein, YkwD family n=1 Tax=Thermoflavimicrobium dichotomicum TaxID=46223 RepID=A0A1I3L1J8_9BACL|nr:CAP domain-containing protein [Thermoflavimicrobium dichotomicum]SFI78623.1 uncharacterized protein, YkwD family [Thermoflavimicrobium dichotomicum]